MPDRIIVEHHFGCCSGCGGCLVAFLALAMLGSAIGPRGQGVPWLVGGMVVALVAAAEIRRYARHHPESWIGQALR